MTLALPRLTTAARRAVLFGGMGLCLFAAPAAATVELRTGIESGELARSPTLQMAVPGGPIVVAKGELRIAEPDQAGQVRLVELSATLLTDVTFTIRDARGERTVWLPPDQRYVERDIASPFPGVEVQLDEHGLAEVWIRVKHRGPWTAPVEVRTPADHVAVSEARSLLVGATLGFALLIFLYNVLMWIVTRERLFGAYSLYLIPCLVVTAATYGVLGLVPGFTTGRVFISLAPLGALCGAGATHFVQVFIGTRERYPRLDRALSAAALAMLALAPVELALPGGAAMLLSTSATVAGVTLILVAIGRALKDDPRETAFFALAWGVLLLVILIGVFAMIDLLPLNLFTSNAVVIGQSLEYALLALAIADRTNLLKNQFERYVPHAFLAELEHESILDIRRGDQVQKDMTVFFSDVRGFTAMSEGRPPQEIFALINDYLGAMGPSFIQHQGFVDKYIGDAIMALFAPGPKGDSADRAVQCAIENLRALRDFNAREGHSLAIGIGLHRGPLTLGMVGSADRLNATVLGDSVNLASRIESLTKRYGAEILMTSAVRDRLTTDIGLRPVDLVRVKGKQEPIEVFEVYEGGALEEQKARTREHFSEGIRAFREGKLEEAKSIFVQLQSDDLAAALYVDRIEGYLEGGLPVDFDGVVTLTSK